MENKYTGEVSIKIGAKEYTLVYDYRAISAFHTKFGINVEIDKMSIDQLVDVIVIGLKKKHFEHSESDLREMIFEASPPTAVMADAVTKAFLYAQHGSEVANEIIEAASKAQENIKKTLAATE